MWKKMNNSKKAVSLMVSYVILITIVVGLSIGVYFWLKILAGNVVPSVECNEGTSVILESKNCFLGKVELIIKNNGRFNVSGIVVSVGNDTKKSPTTFLIPESQGGPIEGHYQFPIPLKPGESASAIFTNKEKKGSAEQIVSFKNITVIQIQPFVIKKRQKIYCQDSVIKQEISGCQIR